MLIAGWGRVTLGAIATLERGRFSARPRNDPRFFGGDIPFVQTGDVAGARHVLESYSQTLNSDGLRVSKVFPAGTILITIAANIGATALTQFPVACPDSVVGIRPLEGQADLAWLKYALDASKASLNEQAGQNAQKNINLQVLNSLSLLMPPLQEQKRIGEILTSCDQTITTTEKLLANSRQQKLSLTSILMTGKQRLLKDKDWQSRSLKELISESRTRGAKGDIAKKITVKLYGRGVFGKAERRVGSDATQYYRRRQGQFIYSKLDFLNGAFGIIPAKLDGFESTLDLPAFDFLPEVDPRWFLYYVSREDFYQGQLSLANGGRKARRVNPSDLLCVAIDVPDIREQKVIADVIDIAAKEEKKWKEMLDALNTQKRGLMSELLTGMRRLRLPATEESVIA